MGILAVLYFSAIHATYCPGVSAFDAFFFSFLSFAILPSLSSRNISPILSFRRSPSTLSILYSPRSFFLFCDSYSALSSILFCRAYLISIHAALSTLQSILSLADGLRALSMVLARLCL